MAIKLGQGGPGEKNHLKVSKYEPAGQGTRWEDRESGTKSTLATRVAINACLARAERTQITDAEVGSLAAYFGQ